MKNLIRPFLLVSVLLTALSSCDDDFNPEDDKIPQTFFMMQLNPDDIHMFNAGNYQVRLEPLNNDSIKVEATVSYSTPLHGTISFIANEGWFYKPDADFFGLDNITYTVCHAEGCGSASITMYVEEPFDPETCVFAITGEDIETTKDASIHIPIFENDIACTYHGMSIESPEKGTFASYSYSGNYKNTVVVYFPPKGFTGTDRFRYRLNTPDGPMEAYCNITVK
jgi:hypothetical protein